MRELRTAGSGSRGCGHVLQLLRPAPAFDEASVPSGPQPGRGQREAPPGGAELGDDGSPTQQIPLGLCKGFSSFCDELST